ncbi:MAG: hypothetical protein WB626_00525 [Bacteroidota bacterium]
MTRRWICSVRSFATGMLRLLLPFSILVGLHLSCSAVENRGAWSPPGFADEPAPPGQSFVPPVKPGFAFSLDPSPALPGNHRSASPPLPEDGIPEASPRLHQGPIPRLVSTQYLASRL